MSKILGCFVLLKMSAFVFFVFLTLPVMIFFMPENGVQVAALGYLDELKKCGYLSNDRYMKYKSEVEGW